MVTCAGCKEEFTVGVCQGEPLLCPECGMKAPRMTTEIKGKRFITIDGLRLLRRALNLPDLKQFGEFHGLREYQKYMRETRIETFRSCHPGMWAFYADELDDGSEGI
jgi:hypothetical protein